MHFKRRVTWSDGSFDESPPPCARSAEGGRSGAKEAVGRSSVCPWEETLGAGELLWKCFRGGADSVTEGWSLGARK